MMTAIAFSAALAAASDLALEAGRQLDGVEANQAVITELVGLDAVANLARARFLALRKNANSAERDALDKVWAEKGERIDARNEARLRELLAGRGCFKTSEIGERAQAAAMGIVNHGSDALRKEMLIRMEPLVATGEIVDARYANIYDRVAVTEGRPQRYGTQGTDCKDGRYAPPANLEDPEELETRRAKMKLQPMADYLAALDKTYGRCEAVKRGA